jgi:hypothetical protein
MGIGEKQQKGGSEEAKEVKGMGFPGGRTLYFAPRGRRVGTGKQQVMMVSWAKTSQHFPVTPPPLSAL